MQTAIRTAVESILYAVACETLTNATAKARLAILNYKVDFRTWEENTIDVTHTITGENTNIEI